MIKKNLPLYSMLLLVSFLVFSMLVTSCTEKGPVSPSVRQYEPLAWDTKEERKAWSHHAINVIDSEFPRLDRASDMTFFCPNYQTLSREQRVNAWGQLFVAIAYYESGWKPTSRMTETTMGTDPITGKQVSSEGLLQLSYQDIKWAKYCEFDWSKDKLLSPTDPNKTILDPFKNLTCGIKIMAGQIDRTGEIMLKSGVYWAVIKEGGKYEKIDGIASYTRKMEICKVQPKPASVEVQQ